MNVPPNTCILTGCDLIDVAEKRVIHGDLFVFDGMFIFNAGTCEWRYSQVEVSSACDKHVLAGAFFEKNKIIVLRAHPSLLSAAARSYIGGEWV